MDAKEDHKKDGKRHGHGAPAHGRAQDRKDGSGRGQQAQQKKGGGGAHNWGNELDVDVNEIVDEVHKDLAGSK